MMPAPDVNVDPVVGLAIGVIFLTVKIAGSGWISLMPCPQSSSNPTSPAVAILYRD